MRSDGWSPRSPNCRYVYGMLGFSWFRNGEGGTKLFQIGSMLTKICAFHYCLGCVLLTLLRRFRELKVNLRKKTKKKEKRMKLFVMWKHETNWNNLMLTWSGLFYLEHIYLVPNEGRPELNVSYSKNRMNDARYVLIVSCFTWTFLLSIRVVSLMLRLCFWHIHIQSESELENDVR